MLDAIAQTLAEQAAKPAPPANVNTPQAALVVPQQTAAAPVLKPTVSAPEALSPSFSQPAEPVKPAQRTTLPLTVAQRTRQPVRVTDPPATAADVQAVQPLPTKNDQVEATTATATDQATINQRLVLKQRLADIVAKDRLLKEAKLRVNLEAMAIAAAQEGQFAQARQMAHEAMLPSEKQGALLAQIDAIEAKQRLIKPTLVRQQPLPKGPQTLAPKSLAEKVKAWAPTTVPGRSLPSVLQFTPPQSSPSYSYVMPVEPQYVSYSLNGFGRSLGGIGVVVDNNTLDFNGQNWTAGYETGGGFNPAELWKGLSFIFPLAVPAPITSGFGWRVHPIRGDRRLHKGVDLGAPTGTPVLAAADGKVELSDWLSGYGRAIILSHQDNTRETLYAHLSEAFVKPGQWVEKGTVIGRVGSTGLSTGPHLHFELRQKTPTGWQAIDPGVQLKSALARLVKAMREG
jgi:murein DD-endopeptidase MepM/ murein hydrolase activator NlpD